SAGLTVLGVSPDAPEKLAAFRDKEGLTFPLLGDPDKTALQAYGAFGEKKNYGRVVQGVIRSTFVVGPDMTVQKAFYNVKATGHVDRIKRELGLSRRAPEGRGAAPRPSSVPSPAAAILDPGGPRGARGRPRPTGRGGRVRGRSPTGRGNRFRGGPVRVRIPPALRPGRR